MTQKQKAFKPTMPKPKGFMTSPLPGPCPKCNYQWGAQSLDLSNRDVEEIPVTFVCARCCTPVATLFPEPSALGSET